MHIVLFDVDNTLTRSQAIDDVLYLKSLTEVFRFNHVDSDWSVYTNATDPGLFCEIFESRVGRAPRESEITAFRSTYVQAIGAAAARRVFRQIEGAKKMLAHLVALPNYSVGIATGAWSECARLKMRSADLTFDDFPSASADDAMARVDIINAAIARANNPYVTHDISAVTYVGDAVWDARACHSLKIPFVGIGEGEHAQLLKSEGAIATFTDYSDIAAFREVLDAAH